MDLHEFETRLLAAAQHYPHVVYTSLAKNDRVQKAWGLFYIIDDPDIDRRLGTFPDGAVPLGPIYRGLRSSRRDLLDALANNREVPFSKVYNLGLGECLEKSILVQLAAQRARRSYLINGGLVLEGEGISCVEAHAFNIVVRDEHPFLIDSQNPLRVDGEDKVSHPYVAPVIGLDRNDNFVMPEEWRQGRIYSLV